MVVVLSETQTISFLSADVRPLASRHNLTAMFCGILWRCLSVLLSYIQSALLSGLILFLCFLYLVVFLLGSYFWDLRFGGV